MAQTILDTEAHLRAKTVPKQFALLADAFLEVEGMKMPVHKAILSAASSVFADLFLAVASASETDLPPAKPCIPMIGHSAIDVQMALQFLYERVGADHANDTPSKWLWHVEESRPILQFAHKYNMQNVLKECDHYLTEKAQHFDGQTFFSDFERTVAWATLADQCDLSYLLAHAELFMVKTADNTFWTSAAARELNPGCLLRMLQAAQFHMNDWASVSANNARQTKEAATNTGSLQAYRPTPLLQKGSHASVSDLRSWRHGQTQAEHSLFEG